MKFPIVRSGPHHMQFQGGQTSKCVRCGVFIRHDVNIGTLPVTCTPTPQWLRDHPDDPYFQK